MKKIINKYFKLYNKKMKKYHCSKKIVLSLIYKNNIKVYQKINNFVQNVRKILKKSRCLKLSLANQILIEINLQMNFNICNNSQKIKCKNNKML